MSMITLWSRSAGLLFVVSISACAPMKHTHDVTETTPGVIAPTGRSIAANNCRKGGAVFDSDGKVKAVRQSCQDEGPCVSNDSRPVCLPSSRDPSINRNIQRVNDETDAIYVFKRTDNQPHPYDVLEPSSCCVWGYMKINGIWTPYCIIPPTGNPPHC